MEQEPNPMIHALISLCADEGMEAPETRDTLLFSAIALSADPEEFLDTCHRMVAYVAQRIAEENENQTKLDLDQ